MTLPRTLLTFAALSLTVGAAHAADFSNPQKAGEPLPNSHSPAMHSPAMHKTDYNKTEPAAGMEDTDSSTDTHKKHNAKK